MGRSVAPPGRRGKGGKIRGSTVARAHRAWRLVAWPEPGRRPTPDRSTDRLPTATKGATPMKLIPLLLLLAGSTMPLTWVAAQTPPGSAPARPAAKPAAKPAAPTAADRTATLGGGSGSGEATRRPILTRDELRSCLNQEETIRLRLADHRAAREPLNRERDEMAKAREELAAERTQVQAVNERIAALRTRMEAHAARVSQWNKDVEAFNSGRPAQGGSGERERLRINAEREALAKAQTELEAERAAVASGGEQVVSAYNAKARALEARVNDWNQRNEAWNTTGRELEAERQGWVDNCADRRYREDDEIAIKAGR